MASIRKRTWKSGGEEHTVWVVDYVDQHGKRHLKTFSTKKEADGWAATALFEVKQGTHTAASASVTVGEAWECWIKHCEAEKLEQGTIKQREQHGELHVKPYLGRVKLSELTMPRVNQFVRELRENSRSLAMRRKVLTNLKTMITFAQGEGLVAQNVARGVKIKADDRNEGNGPLRAGVDFPTMAELKLMMEKSPERWRPFIVTAIFTGMRASELRGLKWSDVGDNSGAIHVRQRADAWGNMGPPKSKAGKRDIPLAPMVINTLRQWKEKCPKRQPEKEGEEAVLDLVFPNGSGNVESHQNIVHRFFDPLQLKCGISVDTGEKDEEGGPIMAPKYGLHALRHAAASLFIAHLGWTPKRLQAVMGHSSITMTFDLYGHLFEDRDADQKAMEKLEAAVVAA